MSYAPYPEMKENKIPWLGSIPAEWDVKALRYIAKPIIGLTYSPTDVVGENEGTLVLRASNIQNGKISLHDNVFVAADIPDKLRIKAGDILVCSRNGSRHLIGKNALILEDHDEWSFGAFTIVIRSEYGPFLYWVMNSRMFEYQSGRFLTTTINQLTTGVLNSFEIPFPSVEEQTAIADFLDKKTAEIDDLIAKKEELLRLLAEQRTALITHAVTKGLNPNAPMKPSGISWLGDVPADWDIRPISTAIQKLESGVSVNAMDAPAEDDQQGVLKTSAVYSGSFDPTQNKLIYDPVEAERLACPVRKGELIISRMNTPDLVGAVGIVKEEYPNLFLPDRLWQTRFWKQATANAPFLYYFLNSKLFRAIIASLASGTSGSMQNITQSDLMKIKIGMPPLSEQSQIVDYLDQALEKLDATRAKTDEAIKTLREYRTAMITNAVTGKIKVA